MFVDLREASGATPAHADVCIIGAGAVGIALALALSRSRLRVLVLENGGLTAEPGGRGIYQVVAGSAPRIAADATRRLYLGGNTNHWGANCRPLDAVDFEAREWIPHSGWPINRQQLQPYYERAQGICGLSDFRWYDPEVCRLQVANRPLALDSSPLASRVVQQCPVGSFADLHRQRLEAANNVRVFLHARAVRLRANAGSGQVGAVELIAADGRRAYIEAGLYVLAAGGIENARLLLCSRAGSGDAFANELVGRCFMEHWSADLPLGRWPYGNALAFYDVVQQAGPARVWGHLVLSDEMMRTHRVAGLAL
ncbi:MAG TPA: FAD-dependent oxidoreductase, partial [Chloroflexota bacterium]|nr:FAD-dependent oxidoreductase [Chloroflexota bacterium]